MPTGQRHLRFLSSPADYEECRCTIGEPHGSDGRPHDWDGTPLDWPEDDESEDQSLSVHDAADIWLSSGMDQDATFGYTEEELRRASDES